MYDIIDIKEKKGNTNAIFLGCGRSINDLNIDFLKDKDVWASNNFIIHDLIIPDFYHLELKEHRNGPTFRNLLNEKKDAYKNVNWILNSHRKYLLRSINPEIYKNIYRYNPAKIPVKCMASLTIILQIMYRMNYEKIYFCGVDLSDSRYFWTDKSDINIPDIMKSCKPDERPSDSIHPTQERNIAEWIKQFGEINNIDFINIAQTSLLSNYIKTVKIN